MGIASLSLPKSPLPQQKQQITVARTARMTQRITVPSLERKRKRYGDNDGGTDDNDNRGGSIEHELPSSNSTNARRRGTSIITPIDGDSNNNNGRKRKKKSQVEEEDEENRHNKEEEGQEQQNNDIVLVPTRYQLSRLLCMIVDVKTTTITSTSRSCTNEDEKGKYSP